MPRYLVLLSALGFVLLSLAARLLPWFALAALGDRSTARSMTTGTVALGAVAALTALLSRWRPSLLAGGLRLVPARDGWRLSLLALGAGAVLFTVVYGVALALGGIEARYVGPAPAAAAGLLALVTLTTGLNAAWEEYTFRGWAFSVCVRAFGPHPVALVLGTLFGLAHLLNPGWTLIAIISIAIAGWLISYVMLASGDIIVPIGLHVGWNLAQSGLTSSRLWKIRQGNVLVCGGSYGLEASLPGITVTALAAAGALILFLRRSRAR